MDGSSVLPGRLTRNLLILILSWTCTAHALDARLRTLQGRELSGRTRWEGDGLSVVDADLGINAHVPLNEIRTLSLQNSTGAATWSASDPVILMSPQGLPVPWESADISAFPLKASSSWQDGTFRIESRAAVLGRDEDACRFLYQPVWGDREILARIGRCSPSHPEARAGLMFRSNLDPASPSLFFGMSVSHGDVLEWRLGNAEPSASQSTPTLPGVRWYKLRRQGDIFSAYRSRDGARWLLVGRTNLSFPPSMLVGITGAGITDYRLHTAVFEHAMQQRRLGGVLRVRTELVSGSVVESPSLEFDHEGLRFGGVQSRPSVRREQVARIVFQPVPGRLDARLRIGQPGVLLTSGEFLEGEPRGLEDGTLLLDSVLTGVQHLDVVNQVLGIVFGPTVRGVISYEIRMQDGSVWRATDIRIVGRSLEIQEPVLGGCRLPLSDLASLQRDIR